MELHEIQVSTPIGPLRLVAGPYGLRAVLWPGEDGTRLRRALVAVGSQPEFVQATQVPISPQAVLEQAQSQLAEYFAGQRRSFDIPLDLRGTRFQLAAWAALREIPYARTISYGEQASGMGDPRASRAVGAANGANPISIIVPCHRVVAASGALTGFAGGLGTKAWLLAHEQAVESGVLY